MSYLGYIGGTGAVAALTVLVAGSLSVFNAHAETWAPAFRGSVIAYQHPLRFKLDCCDTWLTLGLVEAAPERSGKDIRQTLGTRFLSCTGFAGVRLSGRKDDQVAWCNVDDGRMISEILFERGLVKERCELSGNQFGTC